MDRIYLDNAATTGLSPRALSAMLPFFAGEYGNPSAIHERGRRAKMALDEARREVAKAIGAMSTEILFTSGGTESDNWAIRGALPDRPGTRRHLVASAFEHKAVLAPLESLSREGGDAGKTGARRPRLPGDFREGRQGRYLAGQRHDGQ
jgi:cysteine desulfurase